MADLTQLQIERLSLSDRADLLWQAGRDLNKRLDPVHVYRTLRETLQRVVSVNGVVVSDYQAEASRIIAEYVWSDGQEIDVSILPPVPLGPEGEGMQSQVIRSGRGMIFDVGKQVREKGHKLLSVGKEGEVKATSANSPPPTQSAMMVPMTVDEHVVGVVQVMSDQQEAYTQNDVELLETLVLMATAAAQNAKLYQRAQAEVEERKKAEQALTDTREQYRRLLETPLIGVWSIDAEGRTTFANRAVANMLGLTAEELLGRNAMDFVFPEDLQLAESLFDLRRQGVPEQIEFRYRRADGSEVWTRGNASPLYDDSGAFTGAMSILEDISAQRATQEAFRENKQLLDRIVETSPDIIYIFDIVERRTTFSGGRSMELLGYSHDDIEKMRGTDAENLLHPDDVESFEAGFAELQHAEDGKVYTAEYRVRAADGSWRWFLARRTVFNRDETGKVRQILGFGSDITEQRHAQAARRETELRMRTFVNSLPQIAWSSYPDGSSEFLSDWFYEYTGVPHGTPRPEGWRMVVHHEDRPQLTAKLQQSMHDGKPWETEARLKRADGEYRWHIARMVPHLSDSGEIIRWLGTCTDIHALKEAEVELERKVVERTAALGSALAELEGFTYSVSHDLRAPIRAIGSTSMMLKLDHADELSPDAVKLLDTQAAAAKRMATLVDELLRMARLSREELHKEHFDISALAHTVVEEIRKDDRAGTVHFSLQHGLTAYGDARLLGLVLFNLLENAAKFSPEGGTVSFGLTSDNAFFVSDQGIGFDPQYTHKLFRPFERLVRDDEFPGTGIGLANVQRIVQRHGGRVWAESTPGQGAAFYFTLP